MYLDLDECLVRQWRDRIAREPKRERRIAGRSSGGEGTGERERGIPGKGNEGGGYGRRPVDRSPLDRRTERQTGLETAHYGRRMREECGGSGLPDTINIGSDRRVSERALREGRRGRGGELDSSPPS